MLTNLTATPTRWLMRSSNGSLWATEHRYTEAEVKTWQCSQPARRMTLAEEAVVPRGTVRGQRT